jgi:transposase-like protein
MYLAGVSVRRVEDITEILWGTRVSRSTVSDLNKKICGRIEAWHNAPISGAHRYVYLDGIMMKRKRPVSPTLLRPSGLTVCPA